MAHSASTGSRVTPGSECVMALLLPMSTLNRVDLPTLGRPRMAIFGRSPRGEVKPILHPAPHRMLDLPAGLHRRKAADEGLRLHAAHGADDPLDERDPDGTHGEAVQAESEQDDG